MNVAGLKKAGPPPAPPPATASRMTLANVRRGKIKMPLRVVVFGAEGVGKSTFAAGAPNPIFLGADSGNARIDCARLPEPETWQDVLDACDMLATEAHDFETLVVDPLTWIEPLVLAHVVGDSGKRIEDWGGGYGRGFAAALDVWRVFLAKLEILWHRGMNIVLTSHQVVKKFEDPAGPGFERYEMAMNAKAAGTIKQWADFVLFARHEAYGALDERSKKVKGYGTGARILHTQWSAAYDAKAREKIPEELPLSWDTFADAVNAAEARKPELKAKLEAALKQLGDEATTTKVREYLAAKGDNEDRLAEVLNKVEAKIGEMNNE